MDTQKVMALMDEAHHPPSKRLRPEVSTFETVKTYVLVVYHSVFTKQ